MNPVFKTHCVISSGDPGGISYEIVLKSLPSIVKKTAIKHCTVVIHRVSCLFHSSILGLGNPFEHFPEIHWVFVLQEIKSLPVLGQDTATNGYIAISCLEKAIHLTQNGIDSFLLTAPLSKKAVVLNGLKDFRGHTEYLKEESNAKEVTMILANPYFRVALATHHIPLKMVSAVLSQQKIILALKALNSLRILEKSLSSIAVLSLNPHAGEGGILGREEEELIIPTLKEQRKTISQIEGPLPADSFFRSPKQLSSQYILAMYHDQGLIPLKMAAENQGVNLTFGLPFIRVSPDHGVAYDLVSQNKANTKSFLFALDYAIDLMNNKEKGE